MGKGANYVVAKDARIMKDVEECAYSMVKGEVYIKSSS
jgi:hypothetical protein